MNLNHEYFNALCSQWNKDKLSKSTSSQENDPPKPMKTDIIRKKKKKTTQLRSERETSLGNLTQQFIRLLMKAPGWQLDMNEASDALGPKRRLYDVTGVLLGAKLLKKPRKNIVAWSGFRRIDDHCKRSREISFLLKIERKLDEDIEYMEGLLDKIKTLDELYLTKQDVAPLFTDKSVMFVRGPADTDLLVPEQSESFMFTLKTPKDPIDVFLFNDEDDEDHETTDDISPVKDLSAVPFRRTRGAENSIVFGYYHDCHILLRGLNTGPFEESELAPQKAKKRVINFIPLEPANNQNKPPIASYRAEHAAFRSPPMKKLRIS